MKQQPNRKPNLNLLSVVPILTIACATLVAIQGLLAFTKQGGIQRLEMKFDRDGGQFEIEGRDDLPPKLPEVLEEKAASESDRT